MTIAAKLNRPGSLRALGARMRKSLGFKCPAELFTPDAFDFKQHHAALFALGV
jgi:hypothetical protein